MPKRNRLLSNRICGLDEAGRGAWAGPIFVITSMKKFDQSVNA